MAVHDTRLESRRLLLQRSRAEWSVVVSVCLVVSLLLTACRTPPVPESVVQPYRVTDFLGRGDPARQASLRLVVQGLEAEQRQRVAPARVDYERAIQVDATNPWAYLALARYYVEQAEVGRVDALLDQAAALFEAEGLREARIGVYLIGLRGSAFALQGREVEATIYLQRAGSLSPMVWGDGQLSAGELL